jgi:DNA-directed RNA polymerase specialized sigma24 family protein
LLAYVRAVTPSPIERKPLSPDLQRIVADREPDPEIAQLPESDVAQLAMAQTVEAPISDTNLSDAVEYRGLPISLLKAMDHLSRPGRMALLMVHENGSNEGTYTQIGRRMSVDSATAHKFVRRNIGMLSRLLDAEALTELYRHYAQPHTEPSLGRPSIRP